MLGELIKRAWNMSLFRSAGVYGTSNVIERAIPFLLMPVMTRFLSPSDYGVVAMFAVLVSLASPLVGLNLPGAIHRKYFDRENIDFAAYVSNCLVVVVFSIVVTFADFQLVYVLTRGGPANSTHLFATLAYQLGMASGNLGEGAAIAIFMFPILGLVIIFQLWYLRKGDAN